MSGGSRAAQYMLLEQAIREARGQAPYNTPYQLLTPTGREVLARYLAGGRVVFNVDKAHTQGVEAEVSVSPLPGLDLSVAGSFIEAEFDSTLPEPLALPAALLIGYAFAGEKGEPILRVEYLWAGAQVVGLRSGPA